ncbi:hypothetical protein SLA2020_415090 [Shorea laevis]
MEGDLHLLDTIDELENLGSPQHTGVQDSVSNEETQENVHARKPRKRTSAVWDHFAEVEVGGVTKNQCQWCKTKFTKSKSSSTTTLSRHLQSCFKYIGAKKKAKVVVS